jgi:hypothetical protein
MIAENAAIGDLILPEAALVGGVSMGALCVAFIGVEIIGYLLMTKHYMTIHIVNKTSLTFKPM